MDAAHTTMAAEGVKLAPPVAVVGAHYFGMSIDEWIQLLTVLYLLGLIVHQLPKHWAAIIKVRAWIKEKFGA